MEFETCRKRVGIPGDFNEALDKDDTILAADVGTQTDSAVDTILEELVNVTEQDQVGSTVEIKDLTASSPVVNSVEDSDSDHSEEVEFLNAQGEKQSNAQNEG